MKKNTEISDRVKVLIDSLSTNANEFAKKLNYSRSQTIYDILKGKAAPSYDFFYRLLNSEYSESIDIIWLITGENKHGGDVQIAAEPRVEYGQSNIDPELLDTLKDLVKTKERIIDMMEEHIKDLEARLAKAERGEVSKPAH